MTTLHMYHIVMAAKSFKIGFLDYVIRVEIQRNNIIIIHDIFMKGNSLAKFMKI